MADGAVSYQAEIQRALDAAAGLVAAWRSFLHHIQVDDTDWRLSSGLKLRMAGATFRLGATCCRDGVVFDGRDVHNVTLMGGTVIGHNEVGPEGVNLRGVRITGGSSGI